MKTPTDIGALKEKILELEARLKIIEKIVIREDPLYADARRLVIKHRQASALFLQKKLFIDIERAVSLLDRLEKEGIIGPATGIKSRKVLTE